MKNANAASFSAILATLLVFTSGSPLAAQATPVLLQDINTSGASAPTQFVVMGGITYFTADNGVNGSELWRSDGTTAGTTSVKDICPGLCPSWPYGLTVATVPAGERLFFVADDGSQGYELWMSDGSAAGTVLVKDIVSGAGSPAISELVARAGGVLFSANDGVSGYELWKSDGTSGGTVLVKDIVPGGGFPAPSSLTVIGSNVFFTAAVSSSGRELWKSDGTDIGTVLVKDINPGVGSSIPNELTAVGNTLYFAAFTSLGMELWKSDGTSGGTQAIKNINPGFSSSTPGELTAWGGVLYFVADDGSSGRELWRSDGTYAGTVQVKDIYPSSSSSLPSNLTVVDDVLLFAADGGLVGRELWRSDGTGAGTYLVKDINPFNQSQSPDSSPSDLRGSDGMLFFAADGGVAGRELWSSDGTEAATLRVDDLFPGPSDSNPTEFTPSGSSLLFAADNGVDGRELWALQSSGPILGLVKNFAESAVEVGTSGHTFQLTVDNSGTGPAASVRVTDPVDSRLTVSSVSPPTECGDSSGQFVDCTFPTLGPTAFATVTVTYAIGSGVTPANDVLNVAQAGEFGGPPIEASDTVDIVAPCEGPDHIDITEQAIYDIYLAEACVSISAGPTVNVMPGADATLSARDVVVLNDGFVVESGASLTITTN